MRHDSGHTWASGRKAHRPRAEPTVTECTAPGEPPDHALPFQSTHWQNRADGLDSIRVAMGSEEGRRHVARWSRSARAKRVDALRTISLARRSSRVAFYGAMNRTRSSVTLENSGHFVATQP